MIFYNVSLYLISNLTMQRILSFSLTPRATTHNNKHTHKLVEAKISQNFHESEKMKTKTKTKTKTKKKQKYIYIYIYITLLVFDSFSCASFSLLFS